MSRVSFAFKHLFACAVLIFLAGSDRGSDPAEKAGPVFVRPVARLGGTEFRHASKIAAIAFSPDSTLLASAAGEDGGSDSSVRLWEVGSGREKLRFGDGRTRCYCLAFAPDGKLLAGGVIDGSVRLWDVSTGNEVRRLVGQRGRVLSVAFSPDGKRLAAGSGNDSVVRVWNVSTGEELCRLDGHQGDVTALAFTRDGESAISGGPRMDARLRKLSTGEVMRRFGRASALAISPDGALLATADGPVIVWNIASGVERGRLGGNRSDVSGYSVAFAPDSKTMALADWSGSVRIWDVASDMECTGSRSREAPGPVWRTRPMVNASPGEATATQSECGTLPTAKN